jgi:energy-coupling factor transporter ATP-binding protein EcfA2
MYLRDLVTVAPRYARAINLERDAATDAAVDGYVLTQTGQTFLERIAAAFHDSGRHRAWTLTGPYGSGKSAFLLYLSALMGPNAGRGRVARNLLKHRHADTAQSLATARALTREGFAPVLVSGSPGSILRAIGVAAARDLRRLYNVGRPSVAYRRLEAFANSRAEISPRRLVSTLEEITTSSRASGKSRGVLLVIDELGKFLEHAAQGRGAEDLFVLQELAELSAKTKEPTLLLVTVLHQAFENYASALSPRDRQEWEKIQGRFEGFAFQEPADQVLQLIANAIQHAPVAEAKRLRHEARRRGDRAFDLGLAPHGFNKKQFVDTLEGCAPLHPLVVLCLARLCRKFGQNQRSLFSFLTSREPHGFGTFLQRRFDPTEAACFSLEELHDYVAEAFGSALAVGEAAGRWAEGQAALDRGRNLPPKALRLLKSIALLSAVGTDGKLKASLPILQFAGSDTSHESKQALDALFSESIAVERKHSGTIALWEGSDVDIDERIREAARRIPNAGNLAKRANEHWSPRPFVAKRHSYEKGTLRYFKVAFVDVTNLRFVLEAPTDADGVVLFALPSDVAERDELIAFARTSEIRDRLDVIVGVPEDASPLVDAVRELELLRWAQSHTAELQSDAVARRELRSRIMVAESHVATEARRLFSPDEHSKCQTRWFHHGLEHPIPSGRALAEFLSGVCDAVYPCTPILKNELINRRTLSSAAAAARRTLIEAMINRPHLAGLGFEGTPPEVSIYASVLAQTGIHRQNGVQWEFGEPQFDSSLLRLWRRMLEFLDECELERRPVTELFNALQRPPYGLKMGVIPLFFCSALLAHDTEVALYEEGSFLPEITVDAFERLLRSPERFSVRRYRIDGVRREVFRELAQVLGSTPDPRFNLVSIVRPLYRLWNKLPAYSQKTNRVSKSAVGVRDALTAAKEPDRLLFDMLPKACGVDPIPPGDADPKQVREFIQTLRRILIELNRAYEDLVADIRALVLKAFGASDDSRLEVQIRAAALLPHCIEGRLKAFVQQLQQNAVSDVGSVEAIGSLLVGKPPKAWTDVDRARFEVVLAELSRAFRHLEALVFEELKRSRTGAQRVQIFRIGVSDRHSREYESVVSVDARDEGSVAEAVIGLTRTLEETGIAENPQLALAALAMLSRQFLAELDDASAPSAAVQGREVRHGR